MKRIFAVLFLVIFLVSFGAGYFMSVNSAGACNCAPCGKFNCPSPCFCQRIGPCACLTCVCNE